MKFTSTIFLLLLIMNGNGTFGQKTIRLQSPDHHIVVSFQLTKTSPLYKVEYKGKMLVDNSTLGLAFIEDENFAGGLVAGKPIFRKGDETYDLVIGKSGTVHSRYEELTVPLTRSGGAGEKKVNIVIRVFNDGVAFRYEFPAQKNWLAYSLKEELTTFNLAQDPTVLTLFRENFITSHEGYYDSTRLSKVKADTLMDLPTLFQYPGPVYMAITEANLRNYAGMYLAKKKGVLATILSPLPGQTDIKVKAILPHHTPWRVLMISDRVGSLIESNILTNLCGPNELRDVSWIKPGKSTFPWWNGSIVPDTSWSGGLNFETNKYYIDFCARHKIEYHSIVEHGGHEWYVNDGAGFAPGAHADATRAVAGLDMKAICDYARQKGVGIRVWVHWQALYPKLEEAFTQYEKWGLTGLMMDFMDRDDQEMVNIYEEVLRSAAKHKLHIQFHGAFKPSGLHRTFPNEYTREGTYNYEVNKWNEAGLSPDHDINMPFTRLLAGPTDYHLGGFRAVPPAKFKTQHSRPLMVGTRCHMLAMYVVLESYLAMVCDYPAAYEGQPGFKFIEDVPASWDETIVPAAEVHQFVTIARRKGTQWFIGTINSNKARSVQLPLSFLPAGKYTAEIYSDTEHTAEDPNQLLLLVQTVSNADTITLHLAAGGGQAMRLVKQ
ncbi:MAG: glycoside hydrolase family 97 protein [Ferruginibacter sp.]